MHCGKLWINLERNNCCGALCWFSDSEISRLKEHFAKLNHLTGRKTFQRKNGKKIMIQLKNGERNVKHQTCQLTNYENCGEKTTATKSSELTFRAVTRNWLITNQLTAQATQWWSRRIQNVNEFQKTHRHELTAPHYFELSSEPKHLIN